MVINMERTLKAVSDFERLNTTNRQRVIGTLAGLITQHEDRETFLALFRNLDNEEKLIIESRIRDLALGVE